MPAILANAKNFLINSDYPLDKVVYMTSGSVIVPASDYNDISISHGLPFTPLVNAIYSTSSTFDIAYEYNSGQVNTDLSIPSPFLYDTSDTSDATHITLRHTNYSVSPVTLYYRVYAFMPTTASAGVSFTASIADNFTINSDINYTKLILSGATAYSSVVSSTEVIPHGLGYKPQVMAWVENSLGTVSKTFTPILDTGVMYGSGVVVDDTNVTYIRPDFMGGVAERLHYRIYADE